mgnify:CR=1 FL=1
MLEKELELCLDLDDALAVRAEQEDTSKAELVRRYVNRGLYAENRYSDVQWGCEIADALGLDGVGGTQSPYDAANQIRLCRQKAYHKVYELECERDALKKRVKELELCLDLKISQPTHGD